MDGELDKKDVSECIFSETKQIYDYLDESLEEGDV